MMVKKIIVISGGSGVGKNSILKHLSMFRGVCQPVKKYTTRTLDEFEQGSSKVYDYLELDCNEEKIQECQFKYHYANNWYGIEKSHIDVIINRGQVPVIYLRTGSMLVDLKNNYPSIISIYIQSIVDSDEYMISNSESLSENDKHITRRMERFKLDFQDYSKHVRHGLYDYIVLNNFDNRHLLGQLEDIVSENIPNNELEFTKKIFVIMSFSENNHRILPAIKKAATAVSADIKVERIDKVKGKSFSITSEIIRQIEKASLIVCDLTDERPNVYFELGYSMGLNKTIIHCAKTGTRVHFDIANYKTIFYDESFDLQLKIEEEIKYIMG